MIQKTEGMVIIRRRVGQKVSRMTAAEAKAYLLAHSIYAGHIVNGKARAGVPKAPGGPPGRTLHRVGGKYCPKPAVCSRMLSWGRRSLPRTPTRRIF